MFTLLPTQVRALRPITGAIAVAAMMLALLPAASGAQTVDLSQPAISKDEAKAQARAADASPGDGGSQSVEIGLLVVGGILLLGAAFYIMRDASEGTRGSAAQPRKPLDTDVVGRGAPKAMFGGDGEPVVKSAKRKRRDHGRRQRNARKANRPK